MKKKVKDLTITEAKRICDNNKCSSCPLFSTESHLLCMMSAERSPSTYWEREVEIPDELFGNSEQEEERK